VAHTRPRPRIWAYALANLLMHLQCCNFRPPGPFGITLRAGCAIHRAGCRPYAALPLAVTYDIRHRPAWGQLPAAAAGCGAGGSGGGKSADPGF
jgi:hypothetical protein